MLLNLERLDLLIAHYVAGCLPEPARVLVGAHLEMQPRAAQLAARLDDLSGETLEQVAPLALSRPAERVQSILASDDGAMACGTHRFSEDDGLPRYLRAYAGRKLDDVSWKMKLPGLRQHVIEKAGGVETSLLWARPGRALPHHRHQGLELTLVLQGRFDDYRGSFAQGDVSVADETIDHRPVATSDRPCVCFSVLFAPIALSGSGLRMIADIVGI